MKRLTTALLVLLLLAGCATSPEDKAEALFDEAVELTSEYEFDKAASKFAELREMDPTSPAGHFGSGLIYEKQLQYYDALRVYMAIVEVSPAYAAGQAGCWRMLTRLEMYQDALNYALVYNQILSTEPVAKLILAESFMNVGSNRRAQAFLDTALSLGEDPRLVNAMRAQAFARDHKFDSASIAYDQTLGGDESTDITMESVLYLETIGQLDSAVAMSHRATELAGNTNVSLMHHFDLTIRNGYFYEARQAIKQLRDKKTPELVIASLEMLYYYSQEDYTSACKSLSQVERLSESSLSFYIQEMIVRGAVGDELTNTSNFGMLNGLMEREESGSLFSEYLTYFTAMQLATVFTDQKGINGLDMISRRFANRAAIETKKAYLLYRTGQSEEFKRSEEKIIKSYGRQTNWSIKMADIFADPQVHLYNQAEEMYRRTLELDRWYRPALENLVAMHRWLDQPDQAMAVFDDFPYFSEHYPELGLLQAVVLVESNHVDEGLELFLANTDHVGGKIYWFEQLWQALVAADHQDGILKLAAWLADNNGDNTDALVLAAIMLGDEKKYSEAQELTKRAIEAEPENLDAIAYNARSLYYMGEPEVAIGILEASIIADREHGTSNYFLSRFLAMEGIEPQRAGNLARRAVFQSSSALKEWVNLSYVYFQLGKYDFSRGEASKASRSYKGTPEPLFRWGMALYMEGNKEASEKLQEAIDLGLRGDNLREAQQTLKKL
ncbi:MAG: hypothetical protein KOO62_07875 [candidate division Zixibacteria bacterium]|nr:hypothetical protein [candidate division Zixibacteria bacterium]